MPASHGHSEPCCNIPPIIANKYQARGIYEEIGGFKTCTCAPLSLSTVRTSFGDLIAL